MTTFAWRGMELELYDHPHNATLTNERAVELAIADRWLSAASGAGLELGNVLGHYPGPWPRRRIIDRYEEGPGVENLDVFGLGGPFDWILSISTLEHIRMPGEDEPANRLGAVAALYFLRGLLGPAGRMLVTIPLGHNVALDQELRESAHRWGCQADTLVRVRESWHQTDTFVALPYGPDRGANAVWVGTWG